MRKFILFLLVILALGLSCSGDKSQKVTLYEMQVFLLKGSHRTAENIPPFFPGETSVQFVETVMENMEDVKTQLTRTFGYRQLKILAASGFPFRPASREQTFLLQLSPDYLLRVVVFPGRIRNQIPLSVMLVRDSLHLSLKGGKSRELINQSLKDRNRPALFSLRADVPIRKGIILGRAFPQDSLQALFLVLKPEQTSVLTVQNFKTILRKYSNFIDAYGSDNARQFVKAVLKRLAKLDPEADTVRVDQLLPGADTGDILPYNELTVKPKLVKQVAPSYPESARKKGVEGMVVLKIVVNEAGKVDRVDLAKSSGNAALDSSAIAAVNKFEFSPGEKDGRPVKVQMVIPVSFKLRKD